jgi:hypothetical protein
MVTYFRLHRGRDSDIDVIAEGFASGKPSRSNPFQITTTSSNQGPLFHFTSSKGTQTPPCSLASLGNRILCPSVEALEAIAKPSISASALLKFEIPEYLSLGEGNDRISQYEIEVLFDVFYS